MKVSLNWLKDYVDIDLTAEQLAEKLNLSGTAVESVTYLGAKFNNFVVGLVTEVKPHPQADRLRLCQVNIGNSRTLNIVCGAPNVAVGQKVPVALPGAVLPSGIEIKKAKIRGETSEGMICSEAELELGADASGIMVLNETTKVGQPLAEAIGFNDWILELEITPNRPDCLGLIGIAREVAALTGKKVKYPQVKLTEVPEKAKDKVEIKVLAADLCPRYSARVIENVQISSSPDWMKRRLEAVGIRSINNVVDVTNYVLVETGQPLHAFDLDLIKGKQIIIRRAYAGEQLETIDHVERQLTEDMLVIADAERAVALAGIMGGVDSEIRAETKNVLIESAHFLASNIMRTSRSLGLMTESSLRFEKGVDISGTMFAANRAAQLIGEVAGGQVLAGELDNYPQVQEPKEIRFRPTRANQLLGLNLKPEQTLAYLESLGLETKQTTAETYQVTIPTFRVDLEREIDLVEEVARLYGLDNIPATIKLSTAKEHGYSPTQKMRQRVRDLLIACGLNEVYNYSFVSEQEYANLKLPPKHEWLQRVEIANPLSDEQKYLRTHLLPGLLRNLQYNFYRGEKNVQIFELGTVFKAAKPKPEEEVVVGGVLTGNWERPHWYGPVEEVNFYDVKGLLEFLCSELNLADCHLHPADHPIFHPAQAAELVSGADVLGWAGRIHPQIEEAYELDQPVFLFRLLVDQLIEKQAPVRKFAEIPRYPAISLDLSLVVDEQVSWGRIKSLALETGQPLLKEVHLFDVYRGPGIPEGKKSLAFTLTYQAKERTLTDAEVQHIQERIIKRAEKELGAKLR